LTNNPDIQSSHTRTRTLARWTCCAALALLLGAAAPAEAQRYKRGLVPQPAPRPIEGATRVPVPENEHPDLGRLQDELRREAAVENLLDKHDLRHLVAVRSWVDRTGRVADRYLQDDLYLFDDSRDVVQQAAKEALRDYVKQQVGWEEMEDRLRIRVKNFFDRDGGAPEVPEAAAAAPDLGGRQARRHGMGAFEISPQLGVDLDDSKVGLDFGYDPGDDSFWSRWELGWSQHLESDRSRLQLRYSTEKRWMELTAGQGEDFQGGDFVAVSFTALF
jgi:hypothetical protein